MPALYTIWERRDGADRNDFALAALQVCRRARAHGATSSRFWWIDASRIFVLNEGDEATLNVEGFNRDAENASALFALDDLARMVDIRRLGDGSAGQEVFQRAGSPSGT